MIIMLSFTFSFQTYSQKNSLCQVQSYNPENVTINFLIDPSCENVANNAMGIGHDKSMVADAQTWYLSL